MPAITALSRGTIELLLSGRVVCTDLPPGAKVLRMGYDFATDAVILLLDHESYPPVEENHQPQYTTLTFMDRGAWLQKKANEHA